MPIHSNKSCSLSTYMPKKVFLFLVGFHVVLPTAHAHQWFFHEKYTAKTSYTYIAFLRSHKAFFLNHMFHNNDITARESSNGTSFLQWWCHSQQPHINACMDTGDRASLESRLLPDAYRTVSSSMFMSFKSASRYILIPATHCKAWKWEILAEMCSASIYFSVRMTAVLHQEATDFDQ